MSDIQRYARDSVCSDSGNTKGRTNLLIDIAQPHDFVVRGGNGGSTGRRVVKFAAFFAVVEKDGVAGPSLHAAIQAVMAVVDGRCVLHWY